MQCRKQFNANAQWPQTIWCQCALAQPVYCECAIAASNLMLMCIDATVKCEFDTAANNLMFMCITTKQSDAHAQCRWTICCYPPEVWRWAEQKFEILHQVFWHGSFLNNTASIKIKKDANSEKGNTVTGSVLDQDSDLNLMRMRSGSDFHPDEDPDPNPDPSF